FFAQDYLNKARALSESSWQNISNLGKGSSTSYAVHASAASLDIFPGKEGVVDNDVEGGLAVRLKFDEDPSVPSNAVIDFSPKGNNGSFVGNPARSTSSCYAGNCLSLDGVDDQVLLPAPVSGIPTSSITLSAWVRVSNHIDFYKYVSNNWPAAPGAWVLRSNANGGVEFGVVDGALAQRVSGGCAQSFTTSTWHLALGVYDGAAVRVYLDGAPCGTTVNLSNQPLYQNSSIVVGEAGTPLATTHFMDDVRIYNRALSEEEIARIYKSQAFSRRFFVENICRTNDGLLTITAVYPCAGLIEDPSTQKITAITEWFTGGKKYESRLTEYVTRWKNKVFHQTDWSGGGGFDGPIDSPGRTFSSSTGIDGNSVPGSIKIQGI
ncbi:MAG: LamG domain-containing protein, partial [Patescibacteria group bacterium]